MLVGLPAGVAILSLARQWELAGVDLLLGGFSLLAAAMLAVFPQLAAWRDRLTERNRQTETIARASTDEATAHVLSIAAFSFVGATLSVLMSNVGHGLPRAVLSAALSAVATYLALSAFITINLLWDAYERSAKPVAERTRHRDVA